MISSGLTAKATSNDTPVAVVSSGGNLAREATIINEGSVAGFWSINGNSINDADWMRLPAGPSSVTLTDLAGKIDIWVKRVAGGSNVTGVWAQIKEA